MADEISVSITISASKNGALYARSETFTSDMTGDAWLIGVQDVGGDSEDIITHEDLGTYGWVFLKNLDSGSAYVDFGHSDVVADDTICRLYGGESCVLKTAGLTQLHGKSSLGTQKIEYAIIEL